jgi:hypothetical protein
MAELDLLRSLPFDVVEPSAEARARARGRLLRHIRRSGFARRRPLLVSAIGIAILVAGAAFFGLGDHGHGTQSAAAARVLRHAAGVARVQPAPVTLERGQFWYSKSVNAYQVISGGTHPWVALDPKVREIWQGPTGGLLRETSAPPRFLSELDREHWIAAGRPRISAASSTQKLPPPPALDLPTDPVALYAKLHDEAVGNSNGTETEMLTEVGDALRETDESPALRAALYEVAARIPGIELLGPTTDRLGRAGVAVAYSSSSAHERHELIFDPRTSALLGEQYESLDGNVFGYPAGTVTGYATYVSTGVVDALGARPTQ